MDTSNNDEEGEHEMRETQEKYQWEGNSALLDEPLEELEVIDSEYGVSLLLTWRKSPCEAHTQGKVLVNIRIISGQSQADWTPKQQALGWH